LQIYKEIALKTKKDLDHLKRVEPMHLSAF